MARNHLRTSMEDRRRTKAEEEEREQLGRHRHRLSFWILVEIEPRTSSGEWACSQAHQALHFQRTGDTSLYISDQKHLASFTGGTTGHIVSCIYTKSTVQSTVSQEKEIIFDTSDSVAIATLQYKTLVVAEDAESS